MKFGLTKFLALLPLTTLLSVNHNLILSPTSRSIIFSDTLVYIIDNIGYTHSSDFHISFSSKNSDNAYRQTSTINSFLLKTTMDPLVRIDDFTQYKGLRLERRKFTLLLIDSEESFLRIVPLLESRQYETSGKHIVLISETLDTKKSARLIRIIFEVFFRYYIVNVEVIVQNAKTGTMDFYTYYPVSEMHCFKVIPFRHSSFNGNHSEVGIELFPRKFDNFFGCPLTVAVFDSPPHVFVTHKGGQLRVTGIDIKVLAAIAEKLNFSLAYLDGQERGIHANGTLAGAVKLLFDSKANITVGGYSAASKTMRLFSHSVSYLQSAMVFAIPPLGEYSTLEKLLLPFEVDVWIAIGIVFSLTLVTSLTLRAWNKSYRDLVFGNTVRYPIFEMLIVYLGGSVNRCPKGDFARTVILQWLIASLILSCSYKAILFAMLKTGFYKKFPSTIEEMLDEGFVVDASLALMQNLKDGPLGARDAFIPSPLPTMHDHYANVQTGSFKRMVIDTNIEMQHFNSKHFKDGILRALPQRLFIFPYYIYYRKNSYLLEPFDKVVSQFVQSGLSVFWLDTVLNISHLEKTQNSNNMKPLELESFRACFAVCGILISCSIGVFLFEVLSLRLKFLKKILA